MKKKEKRKVVMIVVVGMVCLTFLESLALLKGIDGALFMIVVAVIAGAIGVVVPKPKVISG